MAEFRSVVELSSLNGRNGFQLSGEAAGDSSGYSVSSAGDINGDGFADVIVGADRADPHGYASGASYVVFGKAFGFTATLDLSSLNGSTGFRIAGAAADDRSGRSVAAAGDVNGDGFTDVIVGAPQADPHGDYSGAAYVVFGKASGFAASLQLSNLNGANGFRMAGAAYRNSSGFSVASAGDVNGDGFDDVIVGAPGAYLSGRYSGVSYVVFGKASGFSSSLDLASLNGANGFQLNGNAWGGDSGLSVASAGDVNGDGFADVIIGAPNAPHGDFRGASYVVFGKAGRFPATLELSSLNGANGFQMTGANAEDASGYSVASAGDVNSDGFADVIIGALGAVHGDHRGVSYVVLGKESGFASNLELSSLNGANGFRIAGVAAGDVSGISVASAGDVNGDGYADVIVGASRANAHGKYSGTSYVIFGKASGFIDVDLAGLNGANGFRMAGTARGDYSGRSVASAGDVNGDGFADMIVGAPAANPKGDVSGASYVVFGHRALEAVNRVGTALDNTINGGRGDDTIRGLNGDDKLIAWQGNDLIFGNGGRDRLGGRFGNDRLIGGAGPDILFGGSGNDIFDFNALTDSGATADSRDIIRDFIHLEDKIDLSDLGALAFIGTAAFTGTGQVRVVQEGPNTIVEINLSGDVTPEMTIALEDVAAASLTAEDFIL